MKKKMIKRKLISICITILFIMTLYGSPLPSHTFATVSHTESPNLEADSNGILIQVDKKINSEKKLEKILDSSTPQNVDLSVESIQTEHASYNSALLTLPSDDPLNTSLLSNLEDAKQIIHAEPNYTKQLYSVTNDTFSDYQWYLKDEANADADVDFEEALTSTPTDTPVVAILDTGIDASHEDLSGVLYGSTMYNATTSSAEPFSDTDGHGTHVAGIIAASINNNTGIAGTSSAKLLPIQCFDASGECSDYYILDAINYIIDLKQNKNVNICAMNMSFGGDGGSSLVNEAITSAGKLGIVSVCASGNESNNNDTYKQYPSCYDNDYIISVNASNMDNEPASYSNYGATYTDVFAPGSSILSTYINPKDYQDNISIYAPSIEEKKGTNLFYESFQSFDVTTTASNTGDSSVSISTDNFPPAPSGQSAALSWTFSATEKKDYHLYIPYQTSQNASKGYAGINCKFIVPENDGNKYPFDITVNIKNDTNENSETKTAHYNMTNLSSSSIWNPPFVSNPGEWENFCFRINEGAGASETFLNPEQTYYLCITVTPKKAGDYTLCFDDFGIGTQLSDYSFETGTSMACAVVSGEIGLLKSIYPNATAEELIQRVRTGVDTASVYDGKCSTGGKINFKKAIDAVVEVPTTTEQTTQQASTASQTHTIKYASIAATRIKLNKTKKTIKAGKSFKLKATVYPTSANHKKVVWSSSKKKYATVSKNGKVKTKKAGKGHKVTITCKLKSNKYIMKKCIVKIK